MIVDALCAVVSAVSAEFFGPDIKRAEDSAHYSRLSPAGPGLVASAVSAEFGRAPKSRSLCAENTARYNILLCSQCSKINRHDCL